MSDNHEQVDGTQPQSNEPFNPNMAKALKRARAEFDDKMNMPDGYIEVKLSTVGKVGAPALFYIRNFSPEDLMDLGLSDRENVPIKLIHVLDSLIYNPKNDPTLSIKNFHEKEVIELLLLLYETFYTTVFANQEWIPTEEDWEFLKQQHGGADSDEFRNVERSLKNKTWKPVFDIDIAALDFHELDDSFKTKAKIEREYGNKKFSVVFTLPKFGDFITLKSFIESIYSEKDKRYARIADMYKYRKEMEDKLAAGENVNLASIPNIPKAELDKLKEHETEKTLFSITASKALYLAEFDGQDVSNWPLEKKLELARDARLDYSTFKMVQDHFTELKFGLKEEITVHDPILDKVVTRNYTFQLIDLLTAIRDNRTTKTTISFI